MFKLLSSALKDKDIRSRILYTVMVIVIFRIGAAGTGCRFRAQ